MAVLSEEEMERELNRFFGVVNEVSQHELLSLREEVAKLRQQNADMAAWINAQQEGM